MAFMGVASGARKGKWSLMLDAIYLDVKGEDNFTIPVDGSLINANGSVELTGWILTPSVGYNLLQTERIHLDVLAGARYLYLKADAKSTLVLAPIHSKTRHRFRLRVGRHYRYQRAR